MKGIIMKDYYSELKTLLSKDFNCTPRDFDIEENVLTVPALNEGRRRYSDEKFFFRMVTTGSNVIISADEKLDSALVEFLKKGSGYKLFELPRFVGTHEGKEITSAIGRYGAYIKYDGKFFSLTKEQDPYTIDLEQALTLIQAKQQAAEKSLIKEFAQEDIQIINGRYGPYLKHAGGNYKIPKGKVAEELTIEDCKTIISSSEATNSKKSSAKRSVKSK